MTDAQWIPDVLGDEFEQTTLALGADDEGDVFATLVRALPGDAVDDRTWWDRVITRVPQPRHPLDDIDVLYVHGWSDYFFQKRLARFWTARGARFYALDLRKYGRSLREGQTPGYIADLATYDEDIAAALAAMGDRTGRRLVVFGHSTGGLTLSLWAARHPELVSAVILNSPWLTLQLPKLTRAAAASIIHWSARLAPMDAGPQLDLGFYSRAQKEVADAADPMEINLDWRPEHTMPVHAGWLHAVVQGQARIEAGLATDLPVCLLLSARWALPSRWSEALLSADSVLIVDDIARRALRLSTSVRIERVDGALHDVFLSNHDSREDAYRRLADFARTLAR